MEFSITSTRLPARPQKSETLLPAQVSHFKVHFSNLYLSERGYTVKYLLHCTRFGWQRCTGSPKKKIKVTEQEGSLRFPQKPFTGESSLIHLTTKDFIILMSLYLRAIQNYPVKSEVLPMVEIGRMSFFFFVTVYLREWSGHRDEDVSWNQTIFVEKLSLQEQRSAAWLLFIQESVLCICSFHAWFVTWTEWMLNIGKSKNIKFLVQTMTMKNTDNINIK